MRRSLTSYLVAPGWTFHGVANELGNKADVGQRRRVRPGEQLDEAA